MVTRHIAIYVTPLSVVDVKSVVFPPTCCPNPVLLEKANMESVLSAQTWVHKVMESLAVVQGAAGESI